MSAKTTGEILVIPDTHDEPGVSKERFKWLGKLIIDRKPDTIIHLGDGATMDSLSQYDVGCLVTEGRRYSNDIESFRESMDALQEPLVVFNANARRTKHKQYNPRKVYCIGNHEQRIPKAINKDPKLEGTLSLDHLGLVEDGWEVYPLTVPAEAHGIAFAHYFTSGIMGRAISGINHARSLVAKTYCSTVVGHSHDRSFWEDTDIFGNKVFGLVAGCYFDHELVYTSEEDRNWPGLTMLTVEGGFGGEPRQVNPEFISMHEIKRRYA
jgi:hypothetical protein